MTKEKWIMEQDGKMVIFQEDSKVRREINELIEFFRLDGVKEVKQMVIGGSDEKDTG